MNRPIFFVGNATRKPEFQVSTIAVVNGGRKEYIKIAQTENAKNHISKIHSNYVKLKEIFLDFDIEIAEPTSPKDETSQISFSEINGESLNSQLFDALDSQNDEVVRNILSKYREFLDTIASDYIKGSEHLFGANASKLSTDGQQCIAVIDSIMSNIIVSDGNWNLIDYEWIFDFTVPRDYLMARALFMFCVTYDETFGFATDRIQMTDLKVCRYPQIFEEFASIDDIKLAVTLEKDIQEYVLGYRPPIENAIKLEEPRPTNAGSLVQLDLMVQELFETTHNLNVAVETLTKEIEERDSRIAKMGKELEGLNIELTSIKSSIIFKIGVPIRNIIRKLLPSK